MNDKTIDLPRVQRALAVLDKLVLEHPELCSGDGPRWADNLQELDKMTMGTPVKQRMAEYRSRLRAKGYKGTTINLPTATHERLERLSQQAGLTYGELVTLALEQYEHNTTGGPHDNDHL